MPNVTSLNVNGKKLRVNVDSQTPLLCVLRNSKPRLRQGSYRGLAATANHCAREVHMDELAQLVKMNPVAFRLQNIKDARLKAVLESAADAFGWGKKKADGRGQGLRVALRRVSFVRCDDRACEDRTCGGEF